MQRLFQWLLPLVFSLGAIAAGIALVSVAEAQAGSDSIERPDRTSTVGNYSAVAIDGSDLPIIAYYDTDAQDLRVIGCSTPTCAGTQTINTPDTVGNVGLTPSIQLDDQGLPVIAYYDFSNWDLKLLHCTNRDCSGVQSPKTVVSEGAVGADPSLVLDDDGLPVITYTSYHAAGFQDENLNIVRCNTSNCSSSSSPVTLDSVGNAGSASSLQLDNDGNPVVSYYDRTNSSIKVLHCTDRACSGTQTSFVVADAGCCATRTSLQLDSNGNPVVAFWRNWEEYDLAIATCADPNCATAADVHHPVTEGTTGVAPTLALSSSDNPIVAFQDFDEGSANVLHCTNKACSGTQSAVVVDTEGFAGTGLSMAIDSTGNPVLSYSVTGSGLRLARCGNPQGCGTATSPDPDPDPEAPPKVPRACRNFDTTSIIIGTSGSDRLVGTAGSDIIVGRGGADTIIGMGGDDCLIGGSGRDVLSGGAGRDLILGGQGHDQLRGQGGNDVMRGGKGRDVLNGGGGNDLCRQAKTKRRCER